MSNGKLQVVDDDPSICESLRMIGESCGYKVTTALSAEAFREQYTAETPDIITLDLNLGKSDGIELLRWLADNKSQAKIIVISGYDEKVIHSAMMLGQSQQLNIIASLHKPIDIAQLKSILSGTQENKSIPISQKTLSDAIEKKDFILFYQPKISFKTAKLVGVEALIRWPLKEGAIISPDYFVRLAEESGLIEPLSAWVNHEAIRQCAEFQKMNLDLVVSINISAKLLTNLSLPDDLYTIVKQYDLEPKKICLEITESAAMGNPTITMDVLTRFRIKGFCVSIDDFGTGYSSLVELQRMPCCELKIDKSFTKELEKGSTEYIITRSVINLGHDFGLQIVAEGVETHSAFELLKELKCDIAQGYYIGRPMPLEEFLVWLKIHVDEKMIFNFKKSSSQNN